MVRTTQDLGSKHTQIRAVATEVTERVLRHPLNTTESELLKTLASTVRHNLLHVEHQVDTEFERRATMQLLSKAEASIDSRTRQRRRDLDRVGREVWVAWAVLPLVVGSIAALASMLTFLIRVHKTATQTASMLV
ncbi:MAG: hypothetical protein MHM6MM_005258 [Cercozoa sp. M6MM]